MDHYYLSNPDSKQEMLKLKEKKKTLRKCAQQDGQWHPVCFFSRKLQRNRDNDHKVQGRGQIGWTVPQKETYAVVCCLLNF